MNIFEILITAGVFVGAIWWAWVADWGACEKCNHDCNQGRDCPERKAND